MRLMPAVPAALALCTATPGTASAQDVPFPIQEFQANDETARWLIRYDACAWRSTDELLRQPREALAGLGPVWLCLANGDDWDAIYGRYDAAADRYDVRFHFRVTARNVTLSTEPLDTVRLLAAARAISATNEDTPRELSQSGLRFNVYVRFPGDSLVTVWALPAWQQDGVAAFGAELQDDYRPDGRARTVRHVIAGPIRMVRPDTSVAFRIDSNGDGVPTVGDVFFLYLMRHQFARIRIQTARYSSTLMSTDSGEAWVHVVRDSTTRRANPG